jgi:hypothetical protein
MTGVALASKLAERFFSNPSYNSLADQSFV